ncbi:MAG: DNA polymerase III subunit delta' [Candidatus Omnitrophota bacterium]
MYKAILGQDRAVSFLKGALESDRAAHAYIFTGPAGTGKLLTAVNFAKALNCSSGSGEKPCDECISCRKIDASNHPDVFLLKPDKTGSRLGIDRVREVIKNIGLKPYEAGKKIYIIDGAASLTGEAQNAFLKTLEEPPSDSVIIFIAESSGDLFPTIESRSQAVRFYPLKADDISRILTKVHKLDTDRARILSRIANGSPALALKLNEEKFFERRSSVLKGLVDGSFFDSDFEGLTRPAMRSYLDMMLTWYRDILIAKAAARHSESLLVNADKSDIIKEEAKHLDFRFLDDIIKQIMLTRSFLEQNVNLKLAMSVLGASICTK